MMDTIPVALLEMCRIASCDSSSAEALLSNIDVNTRFVATTEAGHTPYQTTLLAEAACAGNVDMVKLLLQHGADPNLIPDEEPILFMLELPENICDSPQDDARLEVAELLLRSGVDPLVEWESQSLLDDACFELFNYATSYELQYLKRFVLLLILFGGTSEYCCVEQYQPFDLSNTKQYQVFLIKTDSDKLFGEIRSNTGSIVAHF